MSSNNFTTEGQVFRFLAFWLAACLLCYPFMGLYPVVGWCAASVFVLWFFYQLNAN